MDLMSREADAENTDSMLRNSVKFIVPDLVENTTHMRSANGFSCGQISQMHLKRGLGCELWGEGSTFYL